MGCNKFEFTSHNIDPDDGTQANLQLLMTPAALLMFDVGRSLGLVFNAPGKLWQNGFVKSFHGRLRDECLNREWFRDLCAPRVLIER